MLEGKATTQEQKRSDVRRIGLIMVAMMEPANSAENSESTTLQQPKWEGTEIQAFLNATANQVSISELKAVSSRPISDRYTRLKRVQHAFIQGAPSCKCLIPHILVAQVAARIEHRMVSPLETERESNGQL